MAYLLFYYILISAICLWAGILVYSFIPSVTGTKKSLLHYLIMGLICLTAIAQWVNVFYPSRWYVLPAILAIFLLVSVARPRPILEKLKTIRLSFQDRPFIFYLCLLGFLIMILVLNAGPTLMDDTDSYHIQMVKWIQEYGSVPGLANLHLRFGFNSSWFVSIGLLSYPISGFNSFTGLNGLLAFWFCHFLLEKIFLYAGQKSDTKKINHILGYVVLLLICVFNWPMIRGSASSSNYDFITTVCLVVLFVDFLANPFIPVIEWLIWPVYLFTVRMTNMPLMLLSATYLLYTFRSSGVKLLVGGLITGIFLVMPFLIRNLILSGYAFFPLYQLDWFSPDWKADKQALMDILEYVKYYNRVSSGIRPLDEIRKLNFPQWIPAWYESLFPADRFLITLSLSGYLYIIIFQAKKMNPLQICFSAIMGVQLVCWFFSAPDPRFVQGSLLFGIYCAIMMLPVSRFQWNKGVMILMGSLCCFIFIYATSKMISNEKYRNPLFPQLLPAPNVKTIMIDNIALHIPARVLDNWNARCYDVALPCLYQLDPRLMARGKSIADGFRLRKDSLNIPVDGEYKIK